MPRFVAFLRGINVGGNKKVEMAKLKTVMEKAGFAEVKTLLNTGNVIFEAPKASEAALEALLEKAFGFAIPVILRPASAIEALAKVDPFKDITVNENTRLYITFLSEKPKSKTPPATDRVFRIVKVTDGEVVSVLQLDTKNRTPEAMAVLEKTYGKKVTTRNWNTVLKLLA